MKVKICVVVSAEITVKAFLINHLRCLSTAYDLTVILNTKDVEFLNKLGIDARLIRLPIERKISFFGDCLAFFNLIYIFRTEEYRLIHSFTPKAGLLSALAARISGSPLIIHTFTGQIWANKSGLSKFILKFFDALIAYCTTFTLVDSESQRKYLVEEGIVRPEKSAVLANGSLSGVDIQKFCPDTVMRRKLRDELGIRDTDCVFLFLGRITKDKGVLDLITAFDVHCKNNNDSTLLIVGPDEENLLKDIESFHPNLASKMHIIGYTNTPETYMQCSDVFCLPSYREGFGSVVIEAASVGIPAIGSRIYGITDSIVDGKTGYVHDPKNILEITMLMNQLSSDSRLRETLGNTAMDRAHEEFSQDVVTNALLDFYRINLSGVQS